MALYKEPRLLLLSALAVFFAVVMVSQDQAQGTGSPAMDVVVGRAGRDTRKEHSV